RGWPADQGGHRLPEGAHRSRQIPGGHRPALSHGEGRRGAPLRRNLAQGRERRPDDRRRRGHVSPRTSRCGTHIVSASALVLLAESQAYASKGRLDTRGYGHVMAGWRRGIVAALTVATLCGCGSTIPPAGSTTPPAQSPGPTVAVSPSTVASGPRNELLASMVPADHFTAPADPLELTPTPAKGAAVSQVVGRDGGSLVAQGPDGTTYSLAIPAGALPVPTTITMSPLADITGFPFATEPEHRVGVALSPNGLVLVLPATLSIKPAAPLPAGQVATLIYRGAGHDAGAELPDDVSDHVQLTVDHFSGYVAVWPIE